MEFTTNDDINHISKNPKLFQDIIKKNDTIKIATRDYHWAKDFIIPNSKQYANKKYFSLLKLILIVILPMAIMKLELLRVKLSFLLVMMKVYGQFTLRIPKVRLTMPCLNHLISR